MRWITLFACAGVIASAAAREVVVIKPTANLNKPRSIYLELDTYRYSSPSESYRARAVYVQVKPTARFDFGLDRVYTDDGAPAQTYWNLRYVVAPETERAPGVAIGAFEITQGAHPTIYLVGTRTFGHGALHAGVYRQRDQLGWGVAYQQPTALGIDIAVEYYHAPSGDRLTSLCLTCPLCRAISLSIYATANDRTRKLEVFGANVAFNL